jgi:RNA polymerase sigma factor (sigma-70 family)
VQTAETMDLPMLVRASSDGDEDAWNELVRRYAHLVVAVTRQYRLSAADAQDVSQTVWLRLVEHLTDIREPAALAGWIITTARRECLRQLRTVRQVVSVDPLNGRAFDRPGNTDEVDGDLLEAERHRVLLDGLAELPQHQQNFLVLLAADPPHTYAEISRLLGIPIGSIGPTRSRVLDKLRQTNAIRTYLAATREATQTGGVRHAHTELE